MSSLIAEQQGLLPTEQVAPPPPPDAWPRLVDCPHLQADELLQLYARLQLPCSIKGITAETYKKVPCGVGVWPTPRRRRLHRILSSPQARDEITVHRDGLLRAPLPAGIGKCAYVDSMSDEQIERGALLADARSGSFARTDARRAAAH